MKNLSVWIIILLIVRIAVPSRLLPSQALLRFRPGLWKKALPSRSSGFQSVTGRNRFEITTRDKHVSDEENRCAI